MLKDGIAGKPAHRSHCACFNALVLRLRGISGSVLPKDRHEIGEAAMKNRNARFVCCKVATIKS